MRTTSGPSVVRRAAVVLASLGVSFSFAAPASAAPTTIVGDASPDTLTLGGSTRDVAAVYGGDPTGVVTFTLYGDASCSIVRFTSTVPLVSNGGNTATATSGAFAPPAAGTYFWLAAYSGDDGSGAGDAVADDPSVTVCGDAAQTIVVNPPSSNVAINASATATVNLLPAAKCTAGSGPENAVDGAWSNIYTDKWCVPSGKPTLTVQLPRNAYGYQVERIVIRHAGAGGESPTLNTRAYGLLVTQQKVLVSALGLTTYTSTTSTVATVTANTANATTHNVNLSNATGVTLRIDVPTQGTNQATRIYELEVFGTPSPTPPR